jgi:hypothetical protein
MGKTSCGLTLATLLLATGCASDPVDIGDDKTGENLADYAGSWDGYAEAYEFDSGSNRVRLALDSTGRGTMEFGDAPLLPPPTDPEVYLDMDVGYVGVIHAGFRYAVRKVDVGARRIRFGVSPADIAQEWCKLQTPQLYPESTPEEQYYRCTTPSNFTRAEWEQACFVNLDTTPDVRAECAKIQLCGLVCSCSAERCDVRLFEKLEDYPIRIDAALAVQANELVGTLLYGPGASGTDRITIRLTRQ